MLICACRKYKFAVGLFEQMKISLKRAANCISARTLPQLHHQRHYRMMRIHVRMVLYCRVAVNHSLKMWKSQVVNLLDSRLCLALLGPGWLCLALLGPAWPAWPWLALVGLLGSGWSVCPWCEAVPPVFDSGWPFGQFSIEPINLFWPFWKLAVLIPGPAWTPKQLHHHRHHQMMQNSVKNGRIL